LQPEISPNFERIRDGGPAFFIMITLDSVEYLPNILLLLAIRHRVNVFAERLYLVDPPASVLAMVNDSSPMLF
jgi:hypothetical protein